jgi:glycosyltransferase involved in cell wall biosynthesis
LPPPEDRVYRDRRISLVLPSRNERDGLARLLALVPPWVDEVVVADSSTDDSAAVARALGADVVPVARRGYGRALKAGFARATGDLVVAMDADGTYPVEAAELAPLLDRIVDDRADFVSASRFPLRFDPRVMGPARFAGNRIVTAWASLLFLVRFSDVLSGMWAFRRTLVPRFEPLSDGWNFSQEIKILAATDAAIRFAEHRIRYRPRIGASTLAQGHLDLARVGLDNLRSLWRMRWRRGRA